eukprot:TRINITY_DN12654_c0_g1_i1.p1 TRINITY_DN12654_c0_g1~~TRINITY_DN12654_c0_g1_i1.p1  ORF type:complete len:258 (+),score=62.44 TRINITY_DN12654_c0_g1_i1:329-1102(+)
MCMCKVVVLGQGGVGKSSMVIRFCTCYFTDNYNPATKGVYCKHAVFEHAVALHILDRGTADEVQAQSQATQEVGIRENQVAMLVFSLTDACSLEELSAVVELVWRVRGTRRGNGVDESVDGSPPMPMVVCGNKADLEQGRAVSRAAAEAFAQSIRAPYFETSTKTGSNVEEAFRACVGELQRFELENSELGKAAADEARRRRILFVWCALRSSCLPVEIVEEVAALVDWRGGIDMAALELELNKRHERAAGRKCAVQ